MKKLCLLSGMIVLSVVGINASQKLTEEQRRNIEQVQWGKIERQRQLARPAIYTMVDASIKEEPASGRIDENGQWVEETPEKVVVDWPAVFRIIDSMRGTINVNEYNTPLFNDSLIWIAVEQGNALATKMLLEKYKANPNTPGCTVKHEEGQICHRKSLLSVAQHKKDAAIATLLKKHGAHL